MPPPGYSSDRPHIFVLTLSSGSSYFFQAGTADLVHEWEMTCNYWAARLSKEPLTGGVSNMEYGWNRVQPREDPDEDVEDLVSVKSGKSGRSGRYSSSSGFYGGSNSNDRIHINEWKSAASPTTTSVLSEEAQLDALRRYVRSIQSELSQHNSLRSAMNRLVSRLLACSTVIDVFIVYSSLDECSKGDCKLGAQVQMATSGDRQIHDLHTGSRPSHTGPSQQSSCCCMLKKVF